MTKEKYMEFMTNPANVCKCAGCPENRDEKSMSDFRLPCGQYHCWVALSCGKEEK